MTQLILNRVAPASDHFASADSSCVGCSGCGGKPQVLRLLNVSGDSAVVEFSLEMQWSMLWNSWLKPLVALVVAAVLCQGFELDDVTTISLAVMATLMGYASCTVAPLQAINISENPE